MRAATCSSAPPCSKGFLPFWASSACAASATSYPSCSAPPLPWPSAFSWAAHIFKAGRSLLAFGSNSAVKRTASPPLTLAVSLRKTRFIQPHVLFTGVYLLKRLSAGFLPCAGFRLWALRQFSAFLPAVRRLRGTLLFCGLRPSSIQQFLFWLLWLTGQSSRPAFGGRLTFVR